MAGRSESVSDLYIRLGLSTDELESGFVDASRTVRDNMARLSRENTVVDLQAQVEIAGLDETEDSARILEIRMQSLTRKIENQRDRIRLATAELRNMRERNGENSDQAQRAQISLERENLELARLVQQLRRTTAAQEGLNASTSAGSTSTSASSSATAIPDLIGDAIERMNEELSRLPPQAKKVLGATALIVAAIGKGVSVTKDWVNEWKELQKQSYELNMSFEDTENFLDHMRLAGGDIGDWEGFIRGITDAYAKGEWDDPELIVLDRYNAQIVDATGRLKNFKEITDEVYQAWKKANSEGNGIEFLQMLGGEMGVRDALQYLQRFEDAEKRLGEIVDDNVDHNQMQKYQEDFQMLSLQFDKFTGSVISLFAPVTMTFVEEFVKVFRVGTAIVNDAIDAFDELGDAIDNPVRAFIKLKKALGIDLSPSEKSLDSMIDAIDETQEKADKLANDNKNTSEQLNQYTVKRIHAIEDEIKAQRIAIDYENEYQQAIANAELEKANAIREATRQGYISSAERAAIEERYNTAVEIATKEHNDKIEEMTRETAEMQYEASHLAYQKEIYDIEQWKQQALDDLGEYKDAIGDKNQWLKESAAITSKAAQQEAQAFQREMDRIKGEFKSVEEEIFELTHSKYETEMLRAQQRAEEIYQKTGDADIAQRYIWAKAASIDKQAINNPDMLKRPDLQLVNIPDFSNYNELNAQIDKDMERYSKTLNDATNAVRDDMQTLDLDSITENVGNAFNSVDSSANLLADSLANTSDKISNLNFDNQSTPTKNNTPDKTPKANTPAPQPSPNDNKPKNTIPNYNGLNSADINKILKGFTDVNQRFADLTKTAGTIANDLNKKQSNPPQITVSPTISLNLSGSYILTQQMVNQLANDCTEQVANGIYDAVTRATNNLRI